MNLREQKEEEADHTGRKSSSGYSRPTHQWRKALRRNMEVNCSEIRLNISCAAHNSAPLADLVSSALKKDAVIKLVQTQEGHF
eukprot:100216-Pelagomonas_calceolata.AAC.2